MNDLFSTGRYEHNRPYRHIFYLPEKIYRRLTAAKPVYLFGGRGSGKTSLLKTLDWKERIHNQSLIRCFNNFPFEDKIIGIYLKLPQQQIATFERWLSGFDDDQAAAVFGLYLDLLWMEDAIVSLFELSSRSIIKLTGPDEALIFDALGSESCFSFLKSDDQNPASFCKNIRAARERLKQMALLRQDLGSFAAVFPVIEPGELGRRFATIVFGAYGSNCLEGWSLKICFDEAEVLSNQQQTALNSATRHTTAPLCYVFSFVSSSRNLTSTIYANLSVNLADCEPIYLDSVGRAEFCRLVEGVATARIISLLNNSDCSISLPIVFGDFNANDSLRVQLTNSVSKGAKDLLALAEELKSEAFFQDPEEEIDDGEIDSEKNESTAAIIIPERPVRLPIYQAYLISKGVASIPQPETPSWANRAQESAQLRKRMIAAYLSICYDLSLEPLYAGWRAASSIADNSVRDMLFQLDQIFLRTEHNIKMMCSSPLPVRDQDKSIREASNLKLRALPEWVRIPHEKVRRLVETMGFLTQILQTSSADNRHLRSSERGLFILEKDSYDSVRFSNNRKIIEEAIYAGYIVEDKPSPDLVQLRLHRSLAPYFQFSYRGPYYATPLAMADFDLMTDISSPDQPARTASIIASRYDQQQSELPLFQF